MSTHDTVDPVVAGRLQEAAGWWLRLQETPADESMFARWMDWCGADARNMDAYEQIKAIWQASQGPQRQFESKAVRKRPGVRPAALAATFLLVLSATISAYLWFSAPSPSQLLSTPIAMHSDSTLPDGSHITLGAASKLSNRFSQKQRLVEVAAGEAFFKVAKDPQRPFVVQVGEVRVTAIGTAFNVRYGRERIVVTVEEGAVQVSSAQSFFRSSDTLRAAAGQQVSYSIVTRHAAVSNVDPALAIAWQQRVFKYVREPLADVIADLNRYSNRRIEIGDPALAQQLYTGTVFGNHIEDWLGALENAFPVEVIRKQDATLVVSADAP